MEDNDRHRHDFKNQLGIILGFSEMLLADAASDDPRRDDFEEIHKAVTAALELLDRLVPAHADAPDARRTPVVDYPWAGTSRTWGSE